MSASMSNEYKTALTPFSKEHAEKHDGNKFYGNYHQMGQSAGPVLAKAGATGLVHWLEHKTGVKLS
jgi:hypothetical protein